MLPVKSQQQLETLFQRSDLTIHFYNDDFVVATAEKQAADMLVLDEKAFSDGNYYLVYCSKDEQSNYLKDKAIKVLYSDSNRMIVKSNETQLVPAQNDGMVVISNRVARLPRLTRDFPNVTEENPDIRFVLEQVSQDSMYATVAYLQAYRNRKWNTEGAFFRFRLDKEPVRCLGIGNRAAAIHFQRSECGSECHCHSARNALSRYIRCLRQPF